MLFTYLDYTTGSYIERRIFLILDHLFISDLGIWGRLLKASISKTRHAVSRLGITVTSFFFSLLVIQLRFLPWNEV